VVAGLLFGLSIFFATGVITTSLVTGMAMSVGIEITHLLNKWLLQPRLENLTPDWLKLGFEIGSSMLGHLVSTSLALIICSRIFRFSILDTRAWWTVAGMMVGFPIIHGTESTLRYYRQLKEKEKLEERLRNLTTQAELKALKAQINPHFFFNALNTITELVHSDTALAEASIERLATLFRYVLSGSERGQVPLVEELDFVDDYLQIERARFGERLRVNRDIDPGALAVPIPSLILQPLVENAVRHGQGEDGKIDINIKAESNDKALKISIMDRGPGLPAGFQIEDNPGHGLKNVDDRLRKTYGCSLEILETAGGGMTALLTLPQDMKS
jgi:hypothetical protein